MKENVIEQRERERDERKNERWKEFFNELT
jgi:hypothetical protein